MKWKFWKNENIDRLKSCLSSCESALKAWEKVESEMKDNHPCLDFALRADYRKQAVQLTKIALDLIEKLNEENKINSK